MGFESKSLSYIFACKFLSINFFLANIVVGGKVSAFRRIGVLACHFGRRFGELAGHNFVISAYLHVISAEISAYLHCFMSACRLTCSSPESSRNILQALLVSRNIYALKNSISRKLLVALHIIALLNSMSCIFDMI